MSAGFIKRIEKSGSDFVIACPIRGEDNRQYLSHNPNLFFLEEKNDLHKK